MNPTALRIASASSCAVDLPAATSGAAGTSLMIGCCTGPSVSPTVAVSLPLDRVHPLGRTRALKPATVDSKGREPYFSPRTGHGSLDGFPFRAAASDPSAKGHFCHPEFRPQISGVSACQLLGR